MAESSRASGPKMRDSCDQCSTAKVRCTKERPTCGRCERRGHDCEYSSTKRAGRRSHAQSQADNTLHALTPRPCCYQAQLQPGPSINPNADPLFDMTAEPSCHMHNGQQTVRTLDITSHVPATTPLPSTGTEFDEHFGSTAGMSGTEPFDTSMTFSPIDFSTEESGFDVNSAGSNLFPEDCTTFPAVTPTFDYMSLLEDLDSELAEPSGSGSPVGNSMSLFNLPTPSFSSLPAPATACGCYARVWHFYTETSQAAFSNETSDMDASKCLHEIAAAVRESNRMTEAFKSILPCECLRDASLLVIVSLVLFNVLGRCSDAIKPPASSDNRSKDKASVSSTWSDASIMGSHAIHSQDSTLHYDGADDEDPVRVALQRLLAELLNIRRLVTTLSERLEADIDSTEDVNDARSVESSGSDRAGACMMAGVGGSGLPHSLNLASRALQDVCACLRTLSRRIVGMLRAEC